ncbi:putative cyclic nucleotide-gated ion channel 13 [Pistacia vera]|uniref:putative cyclic nucleotide-gated ion channel 13 n=1 Tax=Pistacia vera TaxID=55513 RepID=UPI001262FD45|nr:putative cyclic nucleotide-gated ion channel 13 [Pistacia vera]
MRLKTREIEEWTPFKRLSEDLQQQVKKYHRYIWRKTNGVDVENLFNNLPRDLRMNIKRELCLDLLKKVDEFKKFNEATLDALCDCVKPAFYIERTYFVREGDTIDEMLFVVHGKLWSYAKAKTTASTSSDNRTKRNYLKDGEFCGEELVAWAMDDPSSSNLPMSKRTIQALTKVEAFALMADDLKNVFIKYHLSSPSELNLNHLMIQAARVIQDAWRQHHTLTNSRRAAGQMELGLQVM